MASVAGLDRSFYGRVERGDQHVSLGTLVRLAVALDVTLADLFEGVTVSAADLEGLPRRGAARPAAPPRRRR
jgi:transcriptional regulator with XRE-family HTH domain